MLYGAWWAIWCGLQLFPPSHVPRVSAMIGPQPTSWGCEPTCAPLQVQPPPRNTTPHILRVRHGTRDTSIINTLRPHTTDNDSIIPQQQQPHTTHT